MQVPDRYWERFENGDAEAAPATSKEDVDHTRAALAMCENIDWNVGRMLAELDELKLDREHDRHLLQRQRPERLRAGTAA